MMEKNENWCDTGKGMMRTEVEEFNYLGVVWDKRIICKEIGYEGKPKEKSKGYDNRTSECSEMCTQSLTLTV